MKLIFIRSILIIAVLLSLSACKATLFKPASDKYKEAVDSVVTSVNQNLQASQSTLSKRRAFVADFEKRGDVLIKDDWKSVRKGVETAIKHLQKSNTALTALEATVLNCKASDQCKLSDVIKGKFSPDDYVVYLKSLELLDFSDNEKAKCKYSRTKSCLDDIKSRFSADKGERHIIAALIADQKAQQETMIKSYQGYISTVLDENSITQPLKRDFAKAFFCAPVLANSNKVENHAELVASLKKLKAHSEVVSTAANAEPKDLSDVYKSLKKYRHEQKKLDASGSGQNSDKASSKNKARKPEGNKTNPLVTYAQCNFAFDFVFPTDDDDQEGLTKIKAEVEQIEKFLYGLLSLIESNQRAKFIANYVNTNHNDMGKLLDNFEGIDGLNKSLLIQQLSTGDRLPYLKASLLYEKSKTVHGSLTAEPPISVSTSQHVEIEKLTSEIDAALAEGFAKKWKLAVPSLTDRKSHLKLAKSYSELRRVALGELTFDELKDALKDTYESLKSIKEEAEALGSDD